MLSKNGSVKLMVVFFACGVESFPAFWSGSVDEVLYSLGMGCVRSSPIRMIGTRCREAESVAPVSPFVPVEASLTLPRLKTVGFLAPVLYDTSRVSRDARSRARQVANAHSECSRSEKLEFLYINTEKSFDRSWFKGEDLQVYLLVFKTVQNVGTTK